MTRGVEWLAGLYEGEGTLTRGRDGGVERWNLSINSTDQDVIREARKISGVGHVTFVPARQAHWKDQWCWRVSKRDDIAHVCSILLPYLCSRRLARVEDFLAWYAVAPYGERVRKRSIHCLRCGAVRRYLGAPCLPCAARRAREHRARQSS